MTVITNFADFIGRFKFFRKSTVLRGLFLIAALGMISFGAVGGCSNGNGSDDSEPELIILGDHRDPVLDDISKELRTGPNDGIPNNILIDGTSIDTLDQEEIQLIRDSYNAGFVIVAYEVTKREIAQLYRDILAHKLVYDELEDLDSLADGRLFPVFTIEKHFGRDWSGIADFETSGLRDALEGEVVEPGDPESPYAPHAQHIKKWLDAYLEREVMVMEDVMDTASADELIDELGVRAEFDKELSGVTRDTGGTLLDLASASIHTSTWTVTFQETTNKDTFEITNEAWIVTAYTPDGLYTFLLVQQGFNLQSANGFVKDAEDDKYWALQEFAVKNTYSVGGQSLGQSEAFLIEESPATNASSTSSETTSISTSISGTVGADSDGGSASVTGGVSWSTSITVSKADVSINNVSISDGTLLNDASWQWFPRQAEGKDDGCVNSLYNLADLAHNTFTPATAFIVRIDPDYRGQTLSLDSLFTIQTEQTYLGTCNIFGCNCDVKHHNGLDPWMPSTSQSLAIPEAPEGPAGDDTCSDGIDNDNDGNTDSADSNC